MLVCVALPQAIYKIAEAMQVLGLTQQQQQQQATSCQQHISNGRLTAPADIAVQGKQQDLQQIQQLQQLRVDAAAHTNGAQQQQQQQPKRWAIDVGACPGGWTSYLADSCGYSVIAIDPAELHPDVAARPNVHFIRAKAADALQRVEELLQGGQVGGWLLVGMGWMGVEDGGGWVSGWLEVVGWDVGVGGCAGVLAATALASV